MTLADVSTIHMIHMIHTDGFNPRYQGREYHSKTPGDTTYLDYGHLGEVHLPYFRGRVRHHTLESQSCSSDVGASVGMGVGVGVRRLENGAGGVAG
jgi:hypothetical protein